ncbi:MAG: transcription antitermination factor NusB [Defluviitaleaceae bacterium]|nr:transcription antitermination factor NusB [Defluviitaleaceae bacterium]
MSNPTRVSRHQARRHAFHLIFQFPYHGECNAQTLATATASYYDGLEEGDRPRGRDATYVLRATTGTLDRLVQLDAVINNFLQDWTVERLNRVDLALMRLAIYEMLCEKDVPHGVAINEAVELAKDYGSDESPAFINGVLANVARAVKDDQVE